jgi:hypothetical protein
MQTLVTPQGEAFWAKVFEPEEDRFDEGKPRQWSISLSLPSGSKEAILLVEALEHRYGALHGETKPSKHAWPFREVLDADGAATGEIEFRFKRNEVTAKGKPVPAPIVCDAKKAPWPSGPDAPLIGNGSLVKVAYRVWGWEDKFGKAGISLALEAVQVLKLVAYDRPDPMDSFAEEDGYQASRTADALDAFDEEAPAPSAPKAAIPPQRRQARAPKPAASGWRSSFEPDEDGEVPF